MLKLCGAGCIVIGDFAAQHAQQECRWFRDIRMPIAGETAEEACVNVLHRVLGVKRVGQPEHRVTEQRSIACGVYRMEIGFIRKHGDGASLSVSSACTHIDGKLTCMVVRFGKVFR